jgi:pimeloyl-ACP methyl ester carboxylesterase
MRRGWKILIGATVILAVLLALNTLLTGNQTKPAEANVPGGKILSLQGGDLQVVEGGPRSGTPIVLLHGWTCAIDWWDRIRPLLEREHRVVAIDLLGFGGSEKPDSGYSMESEADLVAHALSRLGIRDATVVGHSLGGTAAVALTEQSPELVERLVVLDQAPDQDYGDGGPFAAKLTFLPVIGPALWRITPDVAIKDGLGEGFAPGYDVPDEFVDDFRRQTYTSYTEVAEAENDYSDEIPLDQRIQESGVPLLAIFGAEEQLYDAPRALAAYAKVPGAETALIPGAGHSPNVERPARTAALVLAFAASGTPEKATHRHEMQKRLQNRDAVRNRP